RRAGKVLVAKLSLSEVPRRIRCAAGSGMRWRNAWRRHGADAREVRFSPGRPRRLARRQEKRLVRILLRGALANGVSGELLREPIVPAIAPYPVGVNDEIPRNAL